MLDDQDLWPAYDHDKQGEDRLPTRGGPASTSATGLHSSLKVNNTSGARTATVGASAHTHLFHNRATSCLCRWMRVARAALGCLSGRRAWMRRSVACTLPCASPQTAPRWSATRASLASQTASTILAAPLLQVSSTCSAPSSSSLLHLLQPRLSSSRLYETTTTLGACPPWPARKGLGRAHSTLPYYH